MKRVDIFLSDCPTGRVSNLIVIGMEMPCPLCKKQITSGQRHSCEMKDGRLLSSKTEPISHKPKRGQK